MFSIMEDVKKPVGNDNPSSDNKGVQDDVQAKIDRTVSKRLAEEKAKTNKRLEEIKAQHEAEIQKAKEEARLEAERVAKLSAEEREKELLAKSQEEIAKKEEELALRENKLAAYQKLSEAGFETDDELVTLVVNSKNMDETIDYLKSKLDKTADKIVAERLEGEKEEAIGDKPKDNSVPTATPVTF